MGKELYLSETEVKPRRFRFLCGFLLAAYCVAVVHPAAPASAETAKNGVAPARAECVMEANSRRILYERNGEARLPMASTTKILTAVTVLENCEDVKEEFEIPPQAAGVEGSSVYLKSGDTYSVEDLLYGLMLRSGNDCAEALALHTSGSIDAFAQRMNETAQKSGRAGKLLQKPARSAPRRTLHHGAGSQPHRVLRHAERRFPPNRRHEILSTAQLGK